MGKCPVPGIPPSTDEYIIFVNDGFKKTRVKRKRKERTEKKMVHKRNGLIKLTKYYEFTIVFYALISSFYCELRDEIIKRRFRIVKTIASLMFTK